MFIVNINASSSDGSTVTVTADKTISEIDAAWDAGKVIVFKTKYQVSNNPYSIYCAVADGVLDGLSNKLEYAHYSVVDVDNSAKISTVFVKIARDDTITVNFKYQN